VHHGGAGTTAAAVRAGIPSVVVPFFGDQPFWAWCLGQLGVAPAALPRRALTAGRLAAAIDAASTVAMRQRARELGGRVRSENGVAAAIETLTAWGLLSGQTPVEKVGAPEIDGRRFGLVEHATSNR
jgi:UDP:flavonoid glycosyltransferase YjiC (YdhE family)